MDITQTLQLPQSSITLGNVPSALDLEIDALLESLSGILSAGLDEQVTAASTSNKVLAEENIPAAPAPQETDLVIQTVTATSKKKELAEHRKSLPRLPCPSHPSFPLKLRQAREARLLTIKELSVLANLSSELIYGYESITQGPPRRPQKRTIKKLESVLFRCSLPEAVLDASRPHENVTHTNSPVAHVDAAAMPRPAEESPEPASGGVITAGATTPWFFSEHHDTPSIDTEKPCQLSDSLPTPPETASSMNTPKTSWLHSVIRSIKAKRPASS